MFPFFLCINLPPSDYSFSKLEKLSKKSPVLIYFIPVNASVTNIFLKIWEKFTYKSREDKNVICVLMHCHTNDQICRYFSFMKPSIFLTIYKKFYQIHNLTDYSIKGLNSIYKSSYADPSSYCQNFYFPEDNNTIEFQYPTFVFKNNETTSCLELSKYKILYPHIHFYIKKNDLLKKNNNYKIDLCYSPSYCIQNSKFHDPQDFIEEYIFDHFGKWTLNDVSNIKRRLVLIVYRDGKSKNIPKRSKFEKYIQAFSNYFLFGQIPFSSIIESIDAYKSADETPFMIVTNIKKTRYMIIDHSQMNFKQIYNKLNAARQGLLEYDMDIFFDSRYSSRNGYNPRNVKRFAFMALAVITFTAFMTFWKVSSCIHMYDNHRHKSIMSL